MCLPPSFPSLLLFDIALSLFDCLPFSYIILYVTKNFRTFQPFPSTAKLSVQTPSLLHICKTLALSS